MFVESSEEGGAAGSSVEPDEDGVVGGGALGGEEEVVHVGGIVINVEVAWVPIVLIDCRNLADFGGSWFHRCEGSYQQEWYQQDLHDLL